MLRGSHPLGFLSLATVLLTVAVGQPGTDGSGTTEDAGLPNDRTPMTTPTNYTSFNNLNSSLAEGGPIPLSPTTTNTKQSEDAPKRIGAQAKIVARKGANEPPQGTPALTKNTSEAVPPVPVSKKVQETTERVLETTKKPAETNETVAGTIKKVAETVTKASGTTVVASDVGTKVSVGVDVPERHNGDQINITEGSTASPTSINNSSGTSREKTTPLDAVTVEQKATTRKHKPKPTATIANSRTDDEKPMPPMPTRTSPLGMPRKIDYIIPVIITIVALPLLGAATFMVYRRGRDCWDKRHYRRMDFLIDGMYND